jgi:hypothetical protein
MAISLGLDGNMQVIEARGQLMQAPDQVCREAGRHVQNLCGQVLTDLCKKDIARFLGAGTGCIHLIDLAGACADTCRTYMDSVDNHK